VNGPSNTHLTEVEITIFIAIDHLVAPPNLDIWMEIKVCNSRFAAAFEQFNSVALPAGLL